MKGFQTRCSRPRAKHAHVPTNLFADLPRGPLKLFNISEVGCQFNEPVSDDDGSGGMSRNNQPRIAGKDLSLNDISIQAGSLARSNSEEYGWSISAGEDKLIEKLTEIKGVIPVLTVSFEKNQFISQAESMI